MVRQAEVLPFGPKAIKTAQKKRSFIYRLLCSFVILNAICISVFSLFSLPKISNNDTLLFMVNLHDNTGPKLVYPCFLAIISASLALPFISTAHVFVYVALKLFSSWRPSSRTIKHEKMQILFILDRKSIFWLLLTCKNAYNKIYIMLTTQNLKFVCRDKQILVLRLVT